MIELNIFFKPKLLSCVSQGGVMRLVPDTMPTIWFSHIFGWHHPPPALSTKCTKWFSPKVVGYHPILHLVPNVLSDFHPKLRGTTLFLMKKLIISFSSEKYHTDKPWLTLKIIINKTVDCPVSTYSHSTYTFRYIIKKIRGVQTTDGKKKVVWHFKQ